MSTKASKSSSQDRFGTKKPSARGSGLLSRSADLSSSPPPPLQQIAFSQRASGNRAVSHGIQSKLQARQAGYGALNDAVRAPCGLAADAPRLPIQAKFTASDPGDPLELEADRIAERVIQRPADEVPASSPTANVIIQRKCTSCEEDERILRRYAAGASRMATTAPAIVHEALSSPGQPLDAETRQFMEPRFGHDFSRVRVHVDDAAADSVNAHAFTVGHRVVFKTNQYRPSSESGRRLLAHELTHVVQQGAIDGASSSPGGAVLARKPVAQQASGLLPPEKVQGVYGDWVQEFLKVRKTTVMTAVLDKEVRDTVKRQVGPGNFANWERWEQAQQAKIDAQAEAENPKSNDEKLLNPQAVLQRRYDQMWADTDQLRDRIVRVEYLAQKLNFGSGVKGTTARITAGGYTALWGIGARAGNSVVEHGPMFGLGAVGLVLGSELAERTLINHGRALKQEGEEMGEDARTAARLVGGDLQAAYQATRPAYNKYQKALSDFGDARVKFKKDLQLDGIAGYVAQAQDITDMTAAMRAMREAGNEYLMACAKMGIEIDAQALNKAGAHIVKGFYDTVGTAVTMVLPEVAPGLGELKSALKGARGMGAKQLEKAVADEAAATIAKTGEEAGAQLPWMDRVFIKGESKKGITYYLHSDGQTAVIVVGKENRAAAVRLGPQPPGTVTIIGHGGVNSKGFTGAPTEIKMSDLRTLVKKAIASFEGRFPAKVQLVICGATCAEQTGHSAASVLARDNPGVMFEGVPAKTRVGQEGLIEASDITTDVPLNEDGANVDWDKVPHVELSE